uniref:Uncharacterized protein n=1 Tax=Onchocerca volvulus TaxID=6282 RepID=A0A8R1TXB6_ONCVO
MTGITIGGISRLKKNHNTDSMIRNGLISSRNLDMASGQIIQRSSKSPIYGQFCSPKIKQPIIPFLTATICLQKRCTHEASYSDNTSAQSTIGKDTRMSKVKAHLPIQNATANRITYSHHQV